MLKIMVIPLVLVLAGILLLTSFRRRFAEELKALSDALVLLLLRSTSRFGSELTNDGKAEQNLWGEQRLRNLQGLALRSREKRGEKPASG